MRQPFVFPRTLLLIALLAGAAQPLTALELGLDDFRITRAGPDLDDSFRAVNPDVVYNAQANEFLVVWSGHADPSEPVEEFEIHAQRLDGDTGAAIGAPIQVSQMGDTLGFGNKGDGPGPAFFEALDPAVAWSSTANEYLVVWWGDDNTPPLVDNKREVFGRRLGADSSPLAEPFRISFMGAEGDTLAEGKVPAVAYNVQENQYLVAWSGDNINGTFIDQETEIWGQRITAGSNTLVGDVIRISDMGSEDGNASFTAADADIAVAGPNYLVVWEGDDDEDDAVNGEDEVYGQLIEASSGLEVGPNDIRISRLGPDGDTGYDATNAVAVYNPISAQFMVALNGSDDEGGAVRNDMEIYLQAVNLDGSLDGDIQRISAMGPDGTDTYWALKPAISVNPVSGEYLVVWRGEDNTGSLVNNEYEMYGQPVNASGNVVRPRRRLSRMGPDGESLYDAGIGNLARNSQTGQFLLVWDGNDNRSDLAERELEVFGQFLLLDIVSASGFE